MTTRVSMVLLLAGVLLAGQALAACGHDEIGRFYDKGIPASRIADRCEMNVDEVADIIAHRRAERADEPEDVYSDEDIPPPPAQRQAYCCDVAGNLRCPIVYGDTTPGTACFCPGQGYGVICQ